MSDDDPSVGRAFRATRIKKPGPGHPVWGFSTAMPGLFDQRQVGRLDQEEEYLMSTGQVMSGRERNLSMADMRRFNNELQKIISQAVRHDGALYSLHHNGIYLFGVDEDGHPTEDKLFLDARIRGGHPQLQEAREWYERAIVGRRQPERPTPLSVAPRAPEPPEGQRLEDRGMGREFIEEHSGEWQPYVNSAGETDERFAQRGGEEEEFRCLEPDCGTVVSSRKSLTGHWRMAHGDRGAIDTEESRARASDTRRYNNLHRKVQEAMTILGAAVDTEEVVRLRAENEDLKAKLSLLREALEA